MELPQEVIAIVDDYICPYSLKQVITALHQIGYTYLIRATRNRHQPVKCMNIGKRAYRKIRLHAELGRYIACKKLGKKYVPRRLIYLDQTEDGKWKTAKDDLNFARDKHYMKWSDEQILMYYELCQMFNP